MLFLYLSGQVNVHGSQKGKNVQLDAKYME
jgi:hypothetical protein